MTQFVVSEKKIVPCPKCTQDSVYAASNPYRPFCSRKCKLLDLGAWASEDFRLPRVLTVDNIDTDV
jgi:endogenous inhibitor of DNA gyrase (YacG/DUF329 family)